MRGRFTSPFAESPPHPPRKSAATSPRTRGEVKKELVANVSTYAANDYCVFATCGAIGCVTNDVASSTAVPSGVGITVRNGTR